MRLFPALATAVFLAASPCMAQVVITNGDYGAAQAHGEAQHHAAMAQHQERRADEDSRSGVRVDIGH
jgi:hypothetical protein